MMNHAEIYGEENLKHLFINKNNWKFKVVYDKSKLVNDDNYIFILSMYVEEEHNPDNCEDNSGLEGILLANGEFCHIPDKNHQRFANAMIDDYPEELHNNIAFLFKSGWSRVSCIKDLTEKQWEWLDKYSKKLDSGQRDSLDELKFKIRKDLMPDLSNGEEVYTSKWLRYGLMNREG